MFVWETLNLRQLSVTVGLEMASTPQVKGKHQAEARETGDGSKNHSQRLGWKSTNWNMRGMSDVGCRSWLSGRYWEKLAACAIQWRSNFHSLNSACFPAIEYFPTHPVWGSFPFFQGRLLHTVLGILFRCQAACSASLWLLHCVPRHMLRPSTMALVKHVHKNKEIH